EERKRKKEKKEKRGEERWEREGGREEERKRGKEEGKGKKRMKGRRGGLELQRQEKRAISEDDWLKKKRESGGSLLATEADVSGEGGGGWKRLG
ncbi:hypothetical protein, partial [Enterococcus faecium]|uniref:hypothetical protein n=1 Tax=Enterococcus faecium TaxID=1352 RepID=UPI003AADF9D0